MSWLERAHYLYTPPLTGVQGGMEATIIYSVNPDKSFDGFADVIHQPVLGLEYLTEVYKSTSFEKSQHPISDWLHFLEVSV